MTGPLTIGIDLGGTQVRAALVRDGEVLRRAAEKTDKSGGPMPVIAQFERLIATVCQDAERARVAGLGVSAPGPLDTEAGVVLDVPTLPGWRDFPLLQTLRQRFEFPVVVENDGIAAGVVIDGRLIHGRRGMAAHVGHLRLSLDGPICDCGAVGCFEALASGTVLGERTRAAAALDPAGFLGQLAARQALDASHAVQGARQGDPQCLALLNEEADYLGAGFTTLLHLYSPELIIMGGGVSEAFDLLSPRVHQRMHRDAMPPFKKIQVVKAALGGNSGLVGAAALAADKAGQSGG
jgi:glucokinase